MLPQRLFPLALAILGLALVVSIALNAYLGFYSRRFYLTMIAAGLDPLGIHYYSDEMPEIVQDPQIKTVVFFGDSRAEGWPAPEGLPGFRFVNRGIGGQTSEQVLYRFDAHVGPLQPDVIVIQVGINDLQAIAMFPARREVIVNRCKANLRSLVDESLDTGAIVILTTIFPRGQISWDRLFFWSDDVDAASGDVNDLIFSLASERVLVFDTAPVLADARGMAHDEYREDFLHLNAAGYAALNAELSKLLLNLGDGQPAP